MNNSTEFKNVAVGNAIFYEDDMFQKIEERTLTNKEVVNAIRLSDRRYCIFEDNDMVQDTNSVPMMFSQL